MSAPHAITIAGGGLAGLSLGLALRRREIPVTVLEAGTYPRHRVCGEFMSGFGQDVLAELGVLPACKNAGARWAETVQFATPTAVGPVRRLPHPALCLSRHRMDELLASAFEASGGDLRTGVRCADPVGREGWVRATGRRPAPPGGTWRWFGIKAHARGVVLGADLELHVGPGAYVGICRLDADRVNICGLFRRRAGDPSPAPRSPVAWLRGPEGTLWNARAGGADFDLASVCTTGGLDLRMRPTVPPGTLLLGDTLAVIPPLTGNGMSLALESARLAAGPLTAFARGELAWTETCASVRHRHHSAFRQRLLWAGILQRLLFAPVAPALLFRILQRSESVWRALFAMTRG